MRGELSRRDFRFGLACISGLPLSYGYRIAPYFPGNVRFIACFQPSEMPGKLPFGEYLYLYLSSG